MVNSFRLFDLKRNYVNYINILILEDAKYMLHIVSKAELISSE